jgi:intraflagellar transport protein 81
MVRERRAKLAPVIKQLRSVRDEHGALETAYLRDKAVYDATAAGLEAERAGLEREADAAQEDALREETRIVELGVQLAVVNESLERAREEATFDKTDARFMRDFKSVKELLTNKATQLEALSKELRKKQRDLKENAVGNAAQRTRFLELARLLTAKVQGMKAAMAGAGGGAGDAGVGGMGGGGGGAAAAGAGGRGRGVEGGAAGGGKTFEDTGGAHVMML